MSLPQSQTVSSSQPGAAARGFKNLVKSSSLIVSARILGALVGIATQIVLARMLSAEALGLFFIAVSVAAVLSILCTLGYPMTVPRIVAQAAAAKEPGTLRAFMYRARIDSAAIALFLISGLVLIALSWPSISSDMRICLVVAAVTTPVFAAIRLNGSLANAHKRFAIGFLPDLFFRPLLLLAFILLAWSLWGAVSVAAILTGHLLIAAGLAGWQIYRVSGLVPQQPPADPSTGPSQHPDARMWRRQAVPLVVAALFIGVFADLDLVIAGAILSEAETGVFGVCLKMSMFVAFGIQAVQQMILRDAADALHHGDSAEVRAVIARGNVLSLLGSIGATIGLVTFGRDILGYFGPAFESGYYSLIILMIAQIVRAAAGPATQILALTGHEKASLPVFATGLVLLLLANLALVPWFGILGASIAVLLVTVVWTIWLALTVRRQLGINTLSLKVF